MLFSISVLNSSALERHREILLRSDASSSGFNRLVATTGDSVQTRWTRMAVTVEQESYKTMMASGAVHDPDST
jgi:hypothetical protein